MPFPAVEFEITPEDWERVNAEHVFASPLYREAARNIRVLAGLLMVTLAALSWVIGSSSVAFLFLLAAPLLVAGAGPLTRHAQRNSLKKLAREGVANGIFGSHRVEVRPDGLFHSTHAYDTLLRWHAIERVEEVAGHFFVYTGPNAFLPIPVTAFRASDDLRAFADAFQERMANAALPPAR